MLLAGPAGRQCARGAARAVPWCMVAAWTGPRRTRASKHTAVVTAETPVDAALDAAAAAAGVALPPSHLQQLSQRLKDNWYSTAADVARLTSEELQQLQMPVRLWALIKSMVAVDEQPAAAAAAAGAAAAAAEAAAGGTRTVLMDALTQQLEPLHEDIMQRRMPRAMRGSAAIRVPTVRLVQPTAIGRYALTAEQMTPDLQADVGRFTEFSCGTWYGQRVPPLSAHSHETYAKELGRLLGYLHNVKGVPLEQLRLASLVPSPGRESVSLLLEYQAWREARGVAARTRVMPIKAVIALCRMLYHEQSQPSAKPPYRDLPVVQELAGMLKDATRAATAAPLVVDESKKFLTWAEFLGFVRLLHAECAGLTKSGKPRHRRHVAMSLQLYLIAAILSVVPDRQRTLRELEVGRTLLRRPDGMWVIKHSAGDYKTGKQYGDRPPLVLAPFLYPELEAFIDTWRAELQPQTRCLFCQPLTGREHTTQSLWKLFRSAALRLTGKATNPHLVRDMIVTHLREQGATEQDMESLAVLMGHSVNEQRKTYDRRTREQKVRPAVDLMLELSKGL